MRWYNFWGYEGINVVKRDRSGIELISLFNCFSFKDLKNYLLDR